MSLVTHFGTPLSKNTLYHRSPTPPLWHADLLESLYGDCEALLGRWFKRTGKRDEIFLADKFGFVKGEGELAFGIDSSGEHCKQACAKSLKLLEIDSIDLCKRSNLYCRGFGVWYQSGTGVA